MSSVLAVSLPNPAGWLEQAKKDPRLLQVAFLSFFLTAGLTVLHFDLPLWQPPLILATACATQWAMTRLLRLPSVGYSSVIISSLGLSLLLRTDLPWMLVLAAFAAIASKFLVRVRGKHIFNPTNFGLALAMLITPHAWCSPSQWGESTAAIAWFAILGFAVAHRAFRSDISLAFLASWILLKTARVLYLGQRGAVLWHQLAVGSLIIFTFFMISDPKTTPNSRAGRVVFAVSVAALAFYLQHGLWKYNTLIWALLFLSPLVPLIDVVLRGDRFQWPGPPRVSEAPPERTSPLQFPGSTPPCSTRPISSALSRRPRLPI
jgi:Na+-transporting NADH:ubiquinone oxidoreductase subunit NqrB